MNVINYERKIIKWAKDRGIFDDPCIKAQAVKLGEEYGELCSAIAKDDILALYDAIGDMVVVLCVISYMEGTTLEECIGKAYDTIKHRTGKMVEGVYVKD